VAERQRQLEAILELSLDGFCLLDAAGKFLWVNEAASAVSGYSRDELLRMTITELEARDGPAELPARIARLRGMGAERFDARHRRKDGRVIDVEVSVQRTDPGEGGGFACFVRDIGERKRAEEAARGSEARFHALIERSSDMIQILDAGGQYLYWSQNALQASGWTPEETLGVSAMALIHEDDRARVGAALAGLLSTPGGIATAAYRFQHKDGTWRQVESVGRNLLEDPAVRGVVINSRDVTDRRQLEEQLRQAQKLDSVGRLAGGVAHDFNNILTVILSCSGALEAKLAQDDLEGHQDLAEIRAASERARDLTRQLLAFARRQAVAPVSLHLNDVVRRSQEMLARLLGEDVELRVQLQGGLWDVHADPGQVDQVLMNLAVNARDAMPRGGVLAMATRNWTAPVAGEARGDEPPPGEWVQLLIRDSGTGMSPEVQAHLFEPFFTTKEQGKGTGLGLATVYGIVTQAGGHVGVRSEPGAGTTFVVSLPRRREAQAQHEAAPAPESTQGTEPILVVEDDDRVRGVIVRALHAQGYQVTALGHPALALALDEDELRRMRLLVSDVVMPGLDGPALARKLTRVHPGLPVLYLSGYTRDAMSERGGLTPGAEFMSKPFDRSALLEKVRAMLDAGERGRGGANAPLLGERDPA
jgi:PAS domain S-box-containing protein